MIQFQSDLDLKLELIIDAPVSKVWRAWTTPELLKPWFCPKPWSVSDCTIDLKPGGAFDVIMQSPEGDQFPNKGCILEVVPETKLIWTNTMTSGFRPVAAKNFEQGFMFTGIIELTPRGNQTFYRATGQHPDSESKIKHEQMGFTDGWTIAAQQLEAFARTF